MLAIVVVMFFISFSSLAASPQGGPKVEANTSNKTSDAKQEPLPLPLPIRIVEEPPESEDAKYRADQASSNEDQDLEAQQKHG